jgi:hypothetical protein
MAAPKRLERGHHSTSGMGASLCALATRQKYVTPIEAVDASNRARLFTDRRSAFPASN